MILEQAMYKHNQTFVNDVPSNLKLQQKPVP